jgi:peptide/nickel transport system permease protein
MLKYTVKRVGLLLPQVLGVILVVFVVVRLVPGNPARAQLGSYVKPEDVERLNEYLGLDKPIWEQFVRYLWNIGHGDLGESWFTGNPVLVDISMRLPASLELITFGIFFALIIGIALGVLGAMPPRGWLHRLINRVTFFYGLTAGAIPDFWFALILILVFSVNLDIAAPPMGRMNPDLSFHSITGFYTIDSLLQGNLRAFHSAVAHLMLPVTTLVFVGAAGVVRMTRNSLEEVLDSDFVWFARANGLPEKIVMRYALRNGLLPILTLAGSLYGILLAGAVLIEQIFNWNGVGQYAVQSVVRADYFALQGVVLIIALFTLLVFLLMDFLYAVLDPRIRY